MTQAVAGSDKSNEACCVALVVCFTGAQIIAPTLSLADVLRCKIEGFSENIFIHFAMKYGDRALVCQAKCN